MTNYHLWNPYTDVSNLVRFLNIGPIVIERGEGAYVYNQHGKKYINAGSSLWNVAVGHGRKELAQAAKEQMETLAYASCHEQTNMIAVKLADKLCEMTDYYYDMAYLACNGSDAVDAAFKVVRQYFRQHKDKTLQGKYKIISFENSYHGSSFGAISASGNEKDKKLYGPLLQGFIQVPPPYAYQKAYGTQEQKECEKRCISYVKEILKSEGTDTIAAFIAEPIMGCYGVIPFSDEFFEALIGLCHEHQILFISDEVSTGFGRTGRMFVCDGWKEKPDILCLSKGISSGYLPLSAMLTTSEIYQNFKKKDFLFEHGCTASGHPVSCAVALRNIQILEEEHLCENATEVGTYLIEKIRELMPSHSMIGDVRGRGLMIGIELLDGEKPMSEEMTYQIMTDCAILGMLTYYERNIIALFPPLIITKEIADDIVSILDKALDNSKMGSFNRKKRAMKAFSESMINKKIE
ncbi:MAG: aspartate aminotransferase family protein [Lachnospiraceae bacterium]|nr:aspartate aminotransferase family protein [Lachnospiraceae bacterium]